MPQGLRRSIHGVSMCTSPIKWLTTHPGSLSHALVLDNKIPVSDIYGVKILKFYEHPEIRPQIEVHWGDENLCIMQDILQSTMIVSTPLTTVPIYLLSLYHFSIRSISFENAAWASKNSTSTKTWSSRIDRNTIRWIPGIDKSLWRAVLNMTGLLSKTKTTCKSFIFLVVFGTAGLLGRRGIFEWDFVVVTWPVVHVGGDERIVQKKNY